MARPHNKIPEATKVAVFRRDRWRCYCCDRGVIFPLSEKFLGRPYDERWSRAKTPRLNDLGASVDHITAWETSGDNSPENLATICAMCNARKGESPLADFLRRCPRPATPASDPDWDGQSGAFLTLAKPHWATLTATERAWVRALEAA